MDLAEFIALELLRLGKINASTLEILLGEFKAGSGWQRAVIEGGGAR